MIFSRGIGRLHSRHNLKWTGSNDDTHKKVEYMPLKIAYLIDSIASNLAGTEKQLIEIIRRLDPESFDPVLICLSSTPWLEANELPCRNYTLGYKGFIKPGFPGVIARLVNIMRKERFDILQTFFEDSIFVGFIGAMLCFSRPVLISSRRDMGLGADNPWYHAVFKALLPYVNRNYDKIVTNASILKKFVAQTEKTDPQRITVIPNGIALPPDDIAVPDIFQRYKADFWIGITANLKHVKRIDLFLEALSYLQSSFEIDFHALVLGDGMERSSLESLRDSLGLSERVHFIGSVDNVYAYLRHLHIGVLCSDREGLSNAILEYMACRLPVVATSAGGNTELIDDDNGILVAPGDAMALSKAMIALACDEAARRKMGEASLRKVSERHTWSITMNQWCVLYHSLVNDKHLIA